VAQTASVEQPKKRQVGDFVQSIQGQVAEILKHMQRLESESGVLNELEASVRDENVYGDLTMLENVCDDAVRLIEEAADRILNLVNRLARKAEAAESLAARGALFIRKRKNQARDEHIMRLRDDRQLSFGQIGKQLKIGREAARKAYYRHKAAISNADKSN